MHRDEEYERWADALECGYAQEEQRQWEARDGRAETELADRRAAADDVVYFGPDPDDDDTVPEPTDLADVTDDLIRPELGGEG